MIEEDSDWYNKFMAEQSGMELVDYKKMMLLRERLREKGEQYEHTPPEEWPSITFNWDIREESQHYSLDIASRKEFLKYYPEGFCLGYVLLEDIDKILSKFSRRDEGELWTLGSSGTLAYLIAYLSEDHPISPPAVKPVNNGEVMLEGGHHRYAIAKALNLSMIPIHVDPVNKEKIDKLLTVNWEA